MKNIVTASIHFSFKGENFAPSVTIELDHHIKTTGTLPNLYQLIAKENDFDLYSYEYEMMQAQEIKFSNAEGLVANFINDGILDLENFQTTLLENTALKQLQKIAKEYMQIEDLEQQPELAKALLSAYHLGKKSQS